MKRILFSILLAISSCILLAQKTKLIKNPETREIYNVLKSDNSLKHGEYQKIGINNTLLFKGFYNMGVKDSIWEYFNSNGEVVQRYNFKTNSLLYYKLDDSEKNLFYKIINGVDNPSVLLDRPPIFLGGNEYFNQVIITNIQYPEEAYKNGISGKVYVSYTIDKNGRMGSFKVVKSLGHGLDDEAVRVLKLIPENWIPGIYNGQPIEVEITYPVTFRIL